MKLLVLSVVALCLFSCAGQTPRAPSSSGNAYQTLLRSSLRFFDEALRDPGSGQYLDAWSIAPGYVSDNNSSVAATGMGLVTLALGDATGTIPGARDKALLSLRAALGDRPGYLSKRAHAGWFRHWFDIRDGRDNDASTGDGYSTIDTAILAAGAQIAANYFAAKGSDPDGALRALADRLLYSVDWDSAVDDLARGSLHLNFDLASEKPKASTSVFNEYLVVACVGHYADLRRGRSGLISKFWNRHYASPAGLPVKSYQGIDLLTDYPGHYLSSFVVQFATYLCSDVSGSEDYLRYVTNEAAADRLWFGNQGAPSGLWGLGAGEVRYRDAPGGQIHAEYAANAIDENPRLIVSPHIVAGFLPVYPAGLGDLLAMYRNGQCLYHYDGMSLLWRCSPRDFTLPFDRIQAVDFSSMPLGLASRHPAVGGLDFFRKFAPGTATARQLGQ